MNNYIENEEKEFSMKWWDFNQYIRFPFGILSVLTFFIQYSKLTLNSISSLLFILNIANGALLIVTYYHFLKRNKVGYKLLNVFLICELLVSTFNLAIKSEKFDIISFVVFIIVYGIVWTLPNYIYFRKRKSLFNNTEYATNRVQKHYMDDFQNSRDDENLHIFINKLEKYQSQHPDCSSNSIKISTGNNFIHKTENMQCEVCNKTFIKTNVKENAKNNLTAPKEKSIDYQESIEEIVTFGIVASVLITLLFGLLILLGYLIYKNNIINNGMTNFIFFIGGVFLVLFVLTIFCIINKTKKDAVNWNNTNVKQRKI